MLNNSIKKIIKKYLSIIIDELISNRIIYKICKITTITPKMLEIKEKEKILIISPHPDDETFGCFSVLESKGEIDIILVSQGALSGRGSRDDIKKIRSLEFQKIRELFKIRRYYDFDLNDSEIDVDELINKFEKINWDYDYVFTPNINDNHPDHRIVSISLKQIKSRIPKDVKIYAYEIWSAFSEYDSYIEITNINNKIEAMKIYKSQMKDLNYIEGVIGLNKYRGLQCNREAVEAFNQILYK